MIPIIKPIDRKLIKKELTPDKWIRTTRKGENELYEITYSDSPNTMSEIGRLREMSFRMSGGGTGKETDIDRYDTDGKDAYRQLIVWDPNDEEIIGGYRDILFGGVNPERRYFMLILMGIFRKIHIRLPAVHDRAGTFVHTAQLPEHQYKKKRAVCPGQSVGRSRGSDAQI